MNEQEIDEMWRKAQKEFEEARQKYLTAKRLVKKLSKPFLANYKIE